MKDNKDLDITDLYNDLEDDIEEYESSESDEYEYVDDNEYETEESLDDDSTYETVEEYDESEEQEIEEPEEDELEEENSDESKEPKKDNKKSIIIIILLIVIVLIIFVFLIKGILSLVGVKKTTEKKSNNNNTVVESNSNSNKNSNEMNDNPDYEIIATFYGNGATLDKYEAMCVTEDKEKGCEISMPDIKREGGTVLGFSKNKNAKTGTIPANGKLTIKEDVTYYAITKEEITAKFVYPRKDNKDTQVSCLVYNEDDKCNIKFPTYTTKGGFDNTWSTKADLTGKIYFGGEELTINNSTTFYASYHHPFYSDKGDGAKYHEDRNISVSRVVNIGNTRFEYEAGIPEEAVNAHVQFISKAYSVTPWIFVPAKVFVLTSNTYSNVSTAYGLTHGKNSYNYIDIQYDSSISAIEDNATIHELAHAWDVYYGYITGTNISDQADITKLYNSLTEEQRKSLSKVEWFAGTATEYYWHYLKMNTDKPSYAGFKDYMTEEQQNEYVTMYQKYSNKSKNGYR